MKIPSFLVNTIKMVDFPASYVSLQEGNVNGETNGQPVGMSIPILAMVACHGSSPSTKGGHARSGYRLGSGGVFFFEKTGEYKVNVW